MSVADVVIPSRLWLDHYIQTCLWNAAALCTEPTIHHSKGEIFRWMLPLTTRICLALVHRCSTKLPSPLLVPKRCTDFWGLNCPVWWCILICPSFHGIMLHELHNEHIDIRRSYTCIRNCMYLSRINKDIQCNINACSACQHIQEKQLHLSFMLTPTHACPWQVLSADLFSFDNVEWLILTCVCIEIPLT